MSGLSDTFSRNLRYWIWKLEHQFLHISLEINRDEGGLTVGEKPAREKDPVLSYTEYGEYSEYDLGDMVDWELTFMDLETGELV